MNSSYIDNAMHDGSSPDRDRLCHDKIDALARMAAGEDLTPPSQRHVSKRPSRKERMFPGNAKIDLKVRNHM